MSRYVALGSSMAAGPGIRPSADGAPFRAGRSARNYPHLVAERLGLDLVDVTYSAATTANALTDPQNGAPPQADALDGSEDLVTVTVGGNDVGYVPLLMAAGLPRIVRSLPLLGGLVRDMLDPMARDRSLVDVAESLKEVGRTLRQRSPRAKVLFVDYLTLLPPAGTSAPPLSDVDVALGRRVADTLERLTGEAAADTGCEWVRVAEASREHHAWSAEPWTTKFGVAVTGQARANAPQHGRHARGRRPRRRHGGPQPEIMNPMIELAGLTKVFGRTRAVDDLTCSVEPGMVTGFLGPNGAGKTTTMRLILGLDHPTAGTATIDGRGYRELSDPLRTVGALLDARQVHPNRSARNHLRWIAASNRIPAKRVDEVLDMVGLTSVAGRNAGTLSLGMSQRLGIAAALLGDPPVLLFDEPVNGLDPEGIRWVRTLMRTLASQGRTVFVSSHLLAEMANTADQLVVIGKGKLIASTTVAEFVGRSGADTVRVRSPQLDTLRRVLTDAGLTAEADHGSALLVRGAAIEVIGDLAARNAITLHELTAQRASLEEAYMQLTDEATEYRAVSQ